MSSTNSIKFKQMWIIFPCGVELVWPGLWLWSWRQATVVTITTDPALPLTCKLSSSKYWNYEQNDSIAIEPEMDTRALPESWSNLCSFNCLLSYLTLIHIKVSSKSECWGNIFLLSTHCSNWQQINACSNKQYIY